MRKIFKKVSAILTSALMIGMSMGIAAATTYPAPFVQGGVADVAVVYGADTPAGIDIVPAANIQANLQSHMGASDGSTTVSGGDNWQVGTSNDFLEIGETFHDVETYIDKSEFSLLSDESISNEKGEAAYSQYLYFEKDQTGNATITYTEDDDDNIGLFLYLPSGKSFARYVMDFTNPLESDVDSDGELSDIEDEMITFLGKTYTITDASNGTGRMPSFTLMSGALGGKVNEGTPLSLNGYTVDVEVTSSTESAFTITSASGTETTSKMNKGDVEKLADGNYLAVTDISYEGYAEGDQSATIYIGADKIEWTSGSNMVVNGETINNAAVNISATWSSGDISITEISINMTAEDDLYVPMGGMLSEATDLDEPEVLVSQNWDIQFAGLEAIEYEDISLKVSGGSDNKYTLRFTNYNGDEVVLPLLYTNSSGTYGGADKDKLLVLDPDGSQNGGNITKNDYFILNTADPVTASNDAKTIVIQYKGADDTKNTNPKATFTINPGGSGEVDQDVSVSATGAMTLKVAGSTFNFVNSSTAVNDDFNIALTGAGDYSDGDGGNVSASTYIRTYYNTLINITDLNATKLGGDFKQAVSAAANQWSESWIVNATIDDTNRDGDDFTLPVYGQLFYVTFENGSATSQDTIATFSATGSWLTDPDDSDVSRYIGDYGFEITYTNPSDSPANVEAKVPKSIVKPLVYITQADGVVVSTTTGGGATQLGEVIYKDTETSSYSNKNVIVVGGSCINSAAASLVGEPACGADFTDKTGIGSGQFLIQSYGADEQTVSSKMVLLVAGYDAADTANAATYLRTQTVDTTAGKKYKGTNSNTAELVVE